MLSESLAASKNGVRQQHTDRKQLEKPSETAKHARLMLPDKGSVSDKETANKWGGSLKMRTLREADGVVTVLELWLGCNDPAGFLHLDHGHDYSS